MAQQTHHDLKNNRNCAFLMHPFSLCFCLQSGVLKFNGLVGLTLEQKLFPEYLKDMGYRTHIIGKYESKIC